MNHVDDSFVVIMVVREFDAAILDFAQGVFAATNKLVVKIVDDGGFVQEFGGEDNVVETDGGALVLDCYVTRGLRIHARFICAGRCVAGDDESGNDVVEVKLHLDGKRGKMRVYWRLRI